MKCKENPKKADSSVHVTKCKDCEEKFVKNSDLEKHLIDKHRQEKAFRCETCDKTFVLEWRMEKHMIMHDENISMCKFFANSQHCPYEEIGCKFSHEAIQEDSIDGDSDNEDEDGDVSYEFIENQCHLCKLQLPNRDDLFNHVETNHQEYHRGMMEIVANRRNQPNGF